MKLDDKYANLNEMSLAELVEEVGKLCGGYDWDGLFTRAGAREYAYAVELLKSRIAELKEKLMITTRLSNISIKRVNDLDVKLQSKDARIAELETLCTFRQAAIERLTAECAGLELMLAEGAEFDPCDDCEYKKQIELLNKVDEFLSQGGRR